MIEAYAALQTSKATPDRAGERSLRFLSAYRLGWHRLNNIVDYCHAKSRIYIVRALKLLPTLIRFNLAPVQRLRNMYGLGLTQTSLGLFDIRLGQARHQAA